MKKKVKPNSDLHVGKIYEFIITTKKGKVCHVKKIESFNELKMFVNVIQNSTDYELNELIFNEKTRHKFIKYIMDNIQRIWLMNPKFSFHDIVEDILYHNANKKNEHILYERVTNLMFNYCQ